MKKLITLSFILLLILFPFATFLNKNQVDSHLIEKEKFDPSLCKNGYTGSWTGACICFKGYEGRYCKIKQNGNQNRESNSLQIKKIYPPFQKNGVTFFLSTELMSQTDAVQFCTQIKKNFRSVTRLDFKCKDTGLNCLDQNLFYEIKKQYGHRGFFWLEEIKNSTKAYYTDLNDGTIYNTEKNNKTTAQALCIQER